MTASLPRIAVIGTGGTISSLGASSLDVLDYPDFGQKLSCEALLELFQETRLVADPVPVTFRQVGSTEIGPKEWIELRAMIHRISRDDPAVASRRFGGLDGNGQSGLRRDDRGNRTEAQSLPRLFGAVDGQCRPILSRRF